jgi:hypothetical protein
MAINSVTASNKMVSPSNPDGYVLGSSNTDVIGFYGATPVARAAAITAPAATAASNSTPYGYTTSAQADAIQVAVNSILTALKANGLLQ